MLGGVSLLFNLRHPGIVFQRGWPAFGVLAALLVAYRSGLIRASENLKPGMETRSRSADAGVEVVYRARPVGFRVNVLTDVLGRNSGQDTP